MRILVVSSTPWNSANSFGLSYTNIFQGIDDLEFANIYCSSGSPDNPFPMVCYQTTFEMLVKNLKNKKAKTYRLVENHSGSGAGMTRQEQQRFNTARTLRWQVLFWARDLGWKLGRWDVPELKQFVEEFKPDIIFTPVYYVAHMNDIVQRVMDYAKVPAIGYISDDCYTLRQVNYSPLYWIDRLWKRRKVKKTIDRCELLYVISQIQKQEYEKIFRPRCKILTKCADFSKAAPQWPVPQGRVKLLYAGNIGTDRWKSLSLLADAVEKLRLEGYAPELDIYTPTNLTAKMEQAFAKNGCRVHPPVPYSEILKLQREADVLVHAEGLCRKARYAVHQSFSTKLVDYFEMAKCIFAIGTPDVASIDHLLHNDAALVAHNSRQVYDRLKALMEDPELVTRYGQKAYACGAAFHDNTIMKPMLLQDMQQIIEENK